VCDDNGAAYLPFFEHTSENLIRSDVDKWYGLAITEAKTNNPGEFKKKGEAKLFAEMG
jgi:hypothetical protein